MLELKEKGIIEKNRFQKVLYMRCEAAQKQLKKYF